MNDQLSRISMRQETRATYKQVVEVAWEEYRKREQEAWEIYIKNIDKIQGMEVKEPSK